MNKKVLSKHEMEQVKELRNTHSDLNWESFATLCNKTLSTNYTESAFRKRLQMYDEALEMAQGQYGTEIDQAIYIEREMRIANQIKKNRTLIGQLNALKKEFLTITEMEETIATFVSPLEKPLFNKLNVSNPSDSATIFMVSDMQEDGSNFSHDIYEKVAAEIINRVRAEKLSKITILENGDGIDGLLRVSDLHHNSGGYVEQLLCYQVALANLLITISKYCLVEFSIVNSNHTELRTLGTQRGQLKNEDVTALILAYLQHTLKNNERVVFLNKGTTPSELNYNILDINGYKIFQHHGDNVGSSPNGADNYFMKILKYYATDIDFVLVAHYHHFVAKTINKSTNKIGDSMVIYNPALDPRQSKNNEQSLMVSSSPAFLRIDITVGSGISKLEIIKTNITK